MRQMARIGVGWSDMFRLVFRRERKPVKGM